MSKSAQLMICALVALLLLLGVQAMGPKARVDLTEDKIYTLSEGSKSLIRSIETPLTLKLYFSKEGTEEIVQIRNYAKRVQELIEEMVSYNPDQLTFQLINPEPFSEAEDEAAAYGLTAAPVGMGRQIYFGLVVEQQTAKDAADVDAALDSEVIEFLQLEREAFLEYDIAQRIYTLADGNKPLIGLISGLEVQGGFDMMTRQPQQPWMAIQQMQSLFEVETIPEEVQTIDPSIDILVLIQPKNMTDQLLYAIDQFALAGGRVFAMVDPLANSDRAAQMGEPSSDETSLNALFQAWGLEIVPGQVVGDSELALMVNQAQGQPVRHIGIQSYVDNFIGATPFTENLGNINLATPGEIRMLEQEGAGSNSLEILPLLSTSNQSGLIGADVFSPDANITEITRNFQPDQQVRNVAVSISGEVNTAFPDGQIFSSDEATEDQATEEQAENTATDADANAETELAQAPLVNEHISSGTINAVVVADTDFLTDFLWVQVLGQFRGQAIAQPFADNGNFFLNTLEFLGGSSDLMSIRSRGTYARPFTRVEALRRAAEERFKSQEIALNEQLEATEQKLSELQLGEGGQVELTPEQQAALVEFQQERLNIRKSLREVSLKLNQEIRDLGFTIKAINIFLIPALLFVLGVVFFTYRQKTMDRLKKSMSV